MTTLDINLRFGAGISQARSRTSLSQIVESCEQSVARKVHSSGADQKSAQLMKNMIPTYFGVFHSLDEMLKKEYHLLGNNPQQTRWAYAINRSARAIVNSLEDEQVRALRSQMEGGLASLVSQNDFIQDTDFKIHKSILQNLSVCGNGGQPLGLQNAYAEFFTQIVDATETILESQMDPDTGLDDIKVIKNGLSFDRPEKIEKLKAKLAPPLRGDKELDTELTIYRQNPRSNLIDLVGNEYGCQTIQAALIRGGTFDPVLNKHPFMEDGSTPRDVIIIYGEPGVGKNFTFDGCCNWADALFKEHGKQWGVYDLKSSLLTSYMSRQAAQFRRQSDLMGMNNFFSVGYMNEADSVSRGSSGINQDEVAKYVGEVKEAVDRNQKGNILYVFITNYPDEFENAFKSRAEFLKLEGPTTKKDFGNLFYRECRRTTNGNGPAAGLSTKDYFAIGSMFHDYRTMFEEKGLTPPVTGRDVHNVASTLLQGDDKSIVQNAHHILSASYDQVVKYKTALVPKITRESAINTIHNYFESRMGANKNYC